MFKVVVFIIPLLELLLQIGEIFEKVLLIKFFFVFPVASFNCAVLSRFTGINQVVNDVMPRAESVKKMELPRRQILAFVSAGITVRKYKSVVGLYRFDGMRKSLYRFLEEEDGMII